MARDYLQFSDDIGTAFEDMGQKMSRLSGYRELLTVNLTAGLQESLLQVLLGYSEFYRSVRLYLAKRRSLVENTKALFKGRSGRITQAQMRFCIADMDRRCERAMQDAYLARDQAQAGAALRIEQQMMQVQESLEQLNIESRIRMGKQVDAFKVQTIKDTRMVQDTNAVEHSQSMIESEPTRRPNTDGLAAGAELENTRLIETVLVLVFQGQRGGLEEVKRFVSRLDGGDRKRWDSAILIGEAALRLGLAEKQRQREGFLRWVRVQGMDVEGILRDRLDRRLDMTGTWIYNDEKISSWLSNTSTTPQMLWLNADPGFGKTFLTAFIVNELQHMQPSGIAHFFCSLNDEPSQRSILAILRSWLHQLLKEVNVLDQKVVHLELPDLTDHRNSENITIDVLCRAFRSLFSQSKDTRLVVDGFDEAAEPANDAQRRDFVQFFKLLADLPRHWKVLLVSRPNEWFKEDLMSNVPSMSVKEINVEDTADDLALYVSDRLQKAALKHRYWRPELAAYAETVLSSGSKGMFMWVNLLVNELELDRGEKRARNTLNQPPSTLGNVYRRTLDRLADQDGRIRGPLWQVLRWVICAHQPLTLPQLEVALSISPDDEVDCDPEELYPEDIEKHLGSLIRIQPVSGAIGYVHASARQFLTSPNAGIGNDKFEPDSGTLDMKQAYTDMTRACLAALCLPETIATTMPRQTEFLWHSAVGWTLYLEEIATNSHLLSDIDSDIDRLFLNQENLISWLRMVYHPQETNASRSGKMIETAVSASNLQSLTSPLDLLARKCRPLLCGLGWSDDTDFSNWGVFMFVQWARSLSLDHSLRKNYRKTYYAT
nr:hypothetical protein B0A51_12895 [Rachicladosporium sp. CCFEE 5018]